MTLSGERTVLDDLKERRDRPLRHSCRRRVYRGDSLKSAVAVKGWDLRVVLRPEESSKKFQVTYFSDG